MFDFIEILDKIDQKLNETLNPKYRQELYKRLVLVSESARDKLISEYRFVLSQEDLKNCYNFLKNICEILNFYHQDMFKQEMNVSPYVTNLNRYINDVLTIISRIPSIDVSDHKKKFSRIYSSFAKKSENLLADTENKINLLLREHKNIEQQLEKLQADLTKKEAEVINLTSNFQNIFSESQEKRSQAFLNSLKKMDNSFKDKFKSIEEESSKHIQQLEERDKKSLGLLGRIAGRVFGEFYTGAANRAKWIAHFLFACAIGYLIVLSYHICTTILVYNSDINWKILFYKTAVLIPLYIPAMYLIYEANRQRDKEEKFQELGIRIEASSPYIEKFESNIQQGTAAAENLENLKIELARKFFAEPSQKIQTKSKKLSYKEIINLLKEFSDIMKNYKN